MKRIRVVAAIINYNEKILCCKRGPHKFNYLSNKWEFPGGKIEHGETEEVALRREIKEELELTIDDLNYFITVTHRYEDFEIEMSSYFAETNEPNLKLNEHTEAEWSNIQDLNNYDWAEADIPIVEALLKKSVND